MPDLDCELFFDQSQPFECVALSLENCAHLVLRSEQNSSGQHSEKVTQTLQQREIAGVQMHFEVKLKHRVSNITADKTACMKLSHVGIKVLSVVEGKTI
jgi:hypothetical protein